MEIPPIQNTQGVSSSEEPSASSLNQVMGLLSGAFSMIQEGGTPLQLYSDKLEADFSSLTGKGWPQAVVNNLKNIAMRMPTEKFLALGNMYNSLANYGSKYFGPTAMQQIRLLIDNAALNPPNIGDMAKGIAQIEFDVIKNNFRVGQLPMHLQSDLNNVLDAKNQNELDRAMPIFTTLIERFFEDHS